MRKVTRFSNEYHTKKQNWKNGQQNSEQINQQFVKVFGQIKILCFHGCGLRILFSLFLEIQLKGCTKFQILALSPIEHIIDALIVNGLQTG